MKRNINIICNNHIQSIANFDNIHIDNTQQIPNCSADNIVLSFVNSLDKDTTQKTLSVLLSKIRPEGSVIVSFLDVNLLCKSYLDNHISNSDLLTMMKPINNIVSLDEVMTGIDISKFRITSISRQNNNIVLSITRIAV